MNEKNEVKLEAPIADLEQKSQLVVKGALGVIPLVGGAAGELFDLAYKSGYEKRLENWRISVSAIINQLIDKSSFDELKQNEEFHSLLAEATLIGLKNHQKIKLDSILNLLLNSTTDPSNYDFKKLFLIYIDQFTEYHLRMIGLIWKNQNVQGTIAHKSYNEIKEQIIEEVFHDDNDLWNLIHEDLNVSKGLITCKNSTTETERIDHLELTELGQRFIQLITE